MWRPRDFGDAGQIFDPIPYLGYLAASTERILLGTAGIVLPLRHPVTLAKEAATVDALSGGRLLLGLASGDRPGEYPFFGADFDRRGETYREGVRVMREIWEQAAQGRIDQDSFLPAPVDGTIPLIGIGGAQQSPAWAAENLDAHMTYHRAGPQMRAVAAQWRAISLKPFMTNLYLDLAENPDAPFEPIRLGARVGTTGLTDYLTGLASAGSRTSTWCCGRDAEMSRTSWKRSDKTSSPPSEPEPHQSQPAQTSDRDRVHRIKKPTSREND
jgi:luciferase-type oxidoreductase